VFLGQKGLVSIIQGNWTMYDFGPHGLYARSRVNKVIDWRMTAVETAGGFVHSRSLNHHRIDGRRAVINAFFFPLCNTM
jgi:hypothetical protein